MIPPPLSDYIGFSLFFFFSALQADISPGVCQTISFYCSSLLGRHISHRRGERGGGGGIRSNTGKLYILLRDFVWVCSCFLDGTMGFFLYRLLSSRLAFTCHITPLVITFSWGEWRGMELFVVCVAHWNHRLAFFFLLFLFWFALGFCALQWYYKCLLGGGILGVVFHFGSIDRQE